MAETISFSQGIGRRELELVRRRFLALHRDRLERILADLRPAQQDFLRLLPLLCHINHPLLPGFVGTEAPAGIPGFQPDSSQLEITRKYWRTFQYQPRALREFSIYALYLMGSVGTVGHSRSSDLDIWLCHRPRLSEEQIATLAAKAKRLEQWAGELGLEAHVFLMDVEEFRQGKLSGLSGDSSGSTQHSLLLEEFYRTGLLLAGRYPLWWLVPPEQERNYTAFAAELVHKRFLDPAECLDFGGLGVIALEEFYGAALWQLFKGVHSPYKSVLKILLNESYIWGHPPYDWLALQIKRLVYAGERDPRRFDSYLLMYQHVEAYLRERGQLERLELARRCLYFKVGEPLGHPTDKLSWRAQQLLELTRRWGWGQLQLEDLDARDRWKMDRVAGERKHLVRELDRSYRLLTEFRSDYGGSMRLDPRELDLLGRRLYTALEDRPSKVELVNPGISRDLSESELSLHWDAVPEGPGVWRLYPGQLDPSRRAGREPMKLTTCLTELLAWCQINGINAFQTRYYLYSGTSQVSLTELRGLVQVLRESLPEAHALEVPLEQLACSPYPVRLVLLVNLGVDPQAHLTRKGKCLLSGRSNPLSYGSAQRCLLHNLELLVLTSWGELVAQHHPDSDGLLDALCFYLDLCRRAPTTASPPELRAEGLATPESRLLAQRVAEVFSETRAFFTQSPSGRYVLGLDTHLFLLEAGERGFRWTQHATEADLLDSLAQPRGQYCPPGCDAQTLSDSPLPAIFRCCRPGDQQLFYYSDQGITYIYVLDETGSLFQQELPGNEPRFLLIQQQRFLESLSRLRRRSGMTEEAVTLITGPRFYRLEQRPESGWQAVPERLPHAGTDDDYLELRLVAESLRQETRLLSLVCGDREFSFLDRTSMLYTEAVQHILSYRKGGAHYPIYLTAVELTQARYGVPPSGVELLALKRRVELRLNEVLRARRVVLVS